MKILSGIGLLFLFLTPNFGLGAEILDINVDEVSVYAAPDGSSEVISTLLKGDSVPVSPKSPAGFKKVLVNDSGKKRIGYVKNSDLGGKPTSLRKGSLGIKGERTLAGKMAIGVSAGLNYQYQGAREYSTGDSAASISVLQGLGVPIGGAFIELAVTKSTKLRAYAEYKTVSVTGTSTLKSTSTGQSGNPTDSTLSGTFISAGGLLKFYSRANGNFWLGGGGQIDKGLSGQIKFQGSPTITQTGADLPNFFMAYLGAGYDLAFSKKVFLVPDIRFGAIMNTTPIIIEADVRLGLAFTL